LFAPILAAIATMLMLLSMSSNARAQQRTFYLDRLQIGGSPNDGFALWRPRMKPEAVFYGQWAVGWQHRPLRGQTVPPSDRLASQTPNPVQNQFTTYLTAGLELMERLSVGVTLPVVVYQHGTSPCARASIPCQSTDVNPVAASDVRLDARIIAYRNRDRKLHLGFAGSLWVASGDDISFTSDDQSHGALQALGEYDFGKFILAANTGVHLRPPRGLNLLHVGNEWTWSVGGFVPLRDGAVRVGGNIYGSTGLGESRGTDTTFTKRNTPLAWLGELRFALDKARNGWFGAGAGTRLSSGYGAPDVRVLATLGYSFPLRDTNPGAPGRRYVADNLDESTFSDRDRDGIPDDLDLCPDEPEDGAEPDPDDGCPAPPDRDRDGIPDESDKCPDQPEDKDGIDDLDGCPEDDFDKDGVPDASDKCPREPGQPSADPEKNGCPQFIRRIEGSTEIQILKKVEFATASSVILPNSFPILDEVLALLNANPDIKKVGVEGHTDIRGAHDMNMRLSQSRAESVMRYLTQKGINASRLTAKGYGPDKPIDSNDTDEGRQRNRRVEFHILEQN
jgi:outer membrane protein OmpA-like peptidoglycan-associated protein